MCRKVARWCVSVWGGRLVNVLAHAHAAAGSRSGELQEGEGSANSDIRHQAPYLHAPCLHALTTPRPPAAPDLEQRGVAAVGRVGGGQRPGDAHHCSHQNCQVVGVWRVGWRWVGEVGWQFKGCSIWQSSGLRVASGGGSRRGGRPAELAAHQPIPKLFANLLLVAHPQGSSSRPNAQASKACSLLRKPSRSRQYGGSSRAPPSSAAPCSFRAAAWSVTSCQPSSSCRP